jgi:hypothetical protein
MQNNQRHFDTDFQFLQLLSLYSGGIEPARLRTSVAGEDGVLQITAKQYKSSRQNNRQKPGERSPETPTA